MRGGTTVTQREHREEHERAQPGHPGAKPRLRPRRWYETEDKTIWPKTELSKGYDLTNPLKLQAMVDVMRWCAYQHKSGKTELLRSINQMMKPGGPFAGMWPDLGSAKKNHQQYHSRVHRILDYVIAIGWIESREPVLAVNGEGVGILVRLGARSSAG